MFWLCGLQQSVVAAIVSSVQGNSVDGARTYRDSYTTCTGLVWDIVFNGGASSDKGMSNQ